MDGNFYDWDLYAVVRGRSAPPQPQPPLPLPPPPQLPPQLPPPPPPSPANPALSYSNPFDVLDYQNNPIPFEDHPEAYFLDPLPPPETTYAFQPPQEIIMPTINLQPTQNLQLTNPQPSRQGRRKNQQRTVYHLTQEELSTDSWAWRKYGLKNIKGSLYPRTYYRCITSKGCSARRQVERSSNDPALFVVSYTGEHTHQRAHPKHSNKLLPSSSSATLNDNGEDDDTFMIESQDDGDQDMFKKYHGPDHDHSSGGGGFYAAHGDGQHLRG